MKSFQTYFSPHKLLHTHQTSDRRSQTVVKARLGRRRRGGEVRLTGSVVMDLVLNGLRIILTPTQGD